MKFIDWYQNLVDKTIECYKNTFSNWASVYGCVAESLVERAYNVPIHLDNTKPDDGYDFIWEGGKFDVKNHCNSYEWFWADTNCWTVSAYKELKADYYLFTLLDPKKKKLAIVGSMDREDIIKKCKFYHKGEQLDGNFKNLKAQSDCYIVKATDLDKF